MQSPDQDLLREVSSSSSSVKIIFHNSSMLLSQRTSRWWLLIWLFGVFVMVLYWWLFLGVLCWFLEVGVLCFVFGGCRLEVGVLCLEVGESNAGQHSKVLLSYGRSHLTPLERYGAPTNSWQGKVYNCTNGTTWCGG